MCKSEHVIVQCNHENHIYSPKLVTLRAGRKVKETRIQRWNERRVYLDVLTMLEVLIEHTTKQVVGLLVFDATEELL